MKIQKFLSPKEQKEAKDLKKKKIRWNNDEDSKIHHLSTEKFDEFIETHPSVMVFFYINSKCDKIYGDGLFAFIFWSPKSMILSIQ